MMRKQSRYILPVILFGIGTVAIATPIAKTLAGYVATDQITRTVLSGGEPEATLFLNSNVWNADKAIFYLNARDKDDSTKYKMIDASKRIYPEINDVEFDLSVFKYSTDKYDRFQFMRVNPRFHAETTPLESSPSIFKVVGSMNSNSYAESTIVFYQDSSDTNHYVANHVALTSGATFKVCDGTNYYNNATTSVDHNHYSISGDGYSNIVVSSTGTYTLDFYLSATNGNHVVLYEEGEISDYLWNYTEFITFSSSVNYYCINGWELNSYTTNKLVADGTSLSFE